MESSVLGILRCLLERWFRSLLRPPSGPALTIAPTSIRNPDQQDIYPRFIVFENTGTAAAFNLEWEVRKYYDSLLPPKYDKNAGRLSTALKPEVELKLELLAGTDESPKPGSRGLALTDLYPFEVLVRYQNAEKQSLLSYVRIGMGGTIEAHDHAVNRFRRALLPIEIWCRHFLRSFVDTCKGADQTRNIPAAWNS